MTISRYLLAALAAMALVLLPPASVKAKVPSVGSPAPEFELPMLDGSRSLKLSSLRARWC